MLTARYVQNAGKLPVAVRGLCVVGEGRLDFDDGDRSGRLVRAAPIGLTCLSLEAASAALASGGARPADDVVVRFDPAAVACADAMPLVKATWRGVLLRITRDEEALQEVFERGRRDLGAAIAAVLGAGQAEGSVHLEAYLRGQNAARRQMDAILALHGTGRPQHLSALLASGMAWSLIADGHGAEVRAVLLAIAEHPADLLDVPPNDFKTLLGLVEACGAQHAFAMSLVPFAPEFCDRNPFFIQPLFRLLATSLDQASVTSMIVAAVAVEARGERRMRHLGRLGVQLAEAAAAETAVHAYRYLDRALGPMLDELPAVRVAFAERVLRASTADLDADQRDRLTAAAPPEARLSLAVADGDRDLARAALTEIADRDGHLRASIETLRLDSANARRLGLRAAEWRYTAYGRCRRRARDGGDPGRHGHPHRVSRVGRRHRGRRGRGRGGRRACAARRGLPGMGQSRGRRAGDLPGLLDLRGVHVADRHRPRDRSVPPPAEPRN